MQAEYMDGSLKHKTGKQDRFTPVLLAGYHFTI